jgi:signal peptidase I
MNGQSSEKKFFWISGNSMLPSYKEGDLVAGEPFTGTLHPGRCYGFAYNGQKLCHRLVCLDKGHAIFAGDNSVHYEAVKLSEIFFAVDESELSIYIYFIRAANGIFYRIRRFFLFARIRIALFKRLLPLLQKATVWNKKNPTKNRK